MQPHPVALRATASSASPRRDLPLFKLLAVLPAALVLLPGISLAGIIGEFGDAPEGVIAYPSLGVTGLFPTCLGGPAGFVYHSPIDENANMFWGQTLDFEPDGNAGICPPPPYEQDECWGPLDGDGGLIAPDTYSIAGGSVVTCGVGSAPAIGTACSVVPVIAGGTFDAHVSNFTPIDGFVNVLFDWDQSGTWGGASPCPTGSAPEHAIINLLVPAGYSGPLSGLGAPPILVGPNPGYVWIRLTVSETPVPVDWNGDLQFELGESEDYLILVDPEEQELGEYGDAPEDAVAYPGLGIMGLFPTCLGGSSGFVLHTSLDAQVNMFWGPTLDFELDGNAGICPPPPYEQDECWGAFDGDGGLLAPDTYTITAGSITTCGAVPPQALGTVCSIVPIVAGGTFDAQVTNSTALDGFINILFDWNQDGLWSGSSPCPGGPAPEHAIVNLPIPSGYSGLLSGLGPPPIQVGPNSSHVWIRLTVSEMPVPSNWDGNWIFELGESEDYLVRIDPEEKELGEYGDAPEDAMAYPGIIGQFPTCTLVGPAGFVYHGLSDLVFFGPTLDWETDGNAGICPQPPYDRDECDATGGDAGLSGPTVYTIVGGLPVPCSAMAGPDLVGCFTARWGVDIDILVNNFTNGERWVNVLADWDDDGMWTGALTTCPDGSIANEHVLVDFPVPPGFSGPLSALSPPNFTVGMPPLDFAWFRFTISDVPVGPGWNGNMIFGDGESEDYLLHIDPAPIDAPELGLGALEGTGLKFQSVRPNPMRGQASVRLSTDRNGWMKLAAYDAAGRLVAVVREEKVDVGVHTYTWNGRDASGREVAPGVYFLRATQGKAAANAKVVVVR